jgi:uncharacterized membrane-anchored protein YjiN (DUF445 family)
MNKEIEEIKQQIKENTNFKYPFDEFWFDVGFEKGKLSQLKDERKRINKVIHKVSGDVFQEIYGKK